jgi:hypothetical protein
VEQGAATSVWCATSTQLDGMGGVYCENCDIAPLVPKEHEANSSIDAPSRFPQAIHQVGSMPLGVMPYAVNPEAADRLWRLSEQLFAGRTYMGLDCRGTAARFRSNEKTETVRDKARILGRGNDKTKNC